MLSSCAWPVVLPIQANLPCYEQVPDAHLECAHLACAKAFSNYQVPIDVSVLPPEVTSITYAAIMGTTIMLPFA